MSLKSLYIKYIFRKLEKRIKAYESKPFLVQQKLLNSILKTYKNTYFESNFELQKINNLNDLKKFKVMDQAELEKFSQLIINENRKGLIGREKLKFLAQTGGSTGKHKHLPYTPKLIKNFQRFQMKTVASACDYIQDFTLLDDDILVNPATLKTSDNPNITIGMATGIMTKLAPKFTKKGIFPSEQTISIKDTNKKIENIKKEVSGRNIKAFSSPPSFAIPILEKIIGDKSNIHEVWKHFKIYIWSGSPIRHYEQRIKQLILETPTFEVYSSTESAVAFQYKIKGQLLLDLDMSVFLFQESQSPLDSKKFSVDEVQLSKRYRILFTTYGGLINYNIGDVIEFTNLKPPMIKVIGREKEDVIIGGAERINQEDLRNCLSKLCKNQNISLRNFVLSPYQNESQKKGYLWYIEFEELPSNQEEFISLLEKEIQDLSNNYKYMRENNARLLPPKLLATTKNGIDEYLNTKKVFAQGKILQVYNDIETARDLMTFLKDYI